MKNKMLFLPLLSFLVISGCSKVNNSSSSSSNKNSSLTMSTTGGNSSMSSSNSSSVSNSSNNSSSSSSTSTSTNSSSGLDSDKTNESKTINVYLIGGQSNAVGYGLDTNNTIANSDSRFINGFDNVLYYGAQERWSGNTTDSQFKPLKLGYGVDYNRSGAEIGIASEVADNNEMNAIIKCAWGATHLYPDSMYDVSFNQGTWTSPSYILNNNVDTSKNEMIGRMYTWFEETVTNGIRLLKDQGYNPIIKGMWWMQGEAEMFTYEMSSAYEELLRTLISDIRMSVSNITGYDCKDMPFVFGLPKWNTKNSAAPAYQNAVRNAMLSVANDSNVVNAESVDCMPLNQHDDWHFDAAGQKYLGENFVRKLEILNEGSTDLFEEKISIEQNIDLLVEEAGMRFRANIANYNLENNNEYGMIFVNKEDLINNDITDNYLENILLKDIKYSKVDCNIVEETINDKYTNYYIEGEISNIEYENLNTHYVAIAFIKNQNGEYLYSSSNVESSVSYLASKAIYETEDNADLLKNYVNAGVNYALDVPENSGYEDANLVLEVEENIVIDYSQTKTVVNLNLKQKPNVNYYVRYSSSDSSIVEVDGSGNLLSKNLGTCEITIECGGKTKVVNVEVAYGNENGITLDGNIDSNEYVGDKVTRSNSNVSIDVQGMVVNGDIYLAFTFTHGEWSPYNSSWYLNDNIEFKINGGRSHTIIFYNGVPTFSSNIDRGVANTKEVGDRLVTTVELCVKGADSEYKLNVGLNGQNTGWLGAFWTTDLYEHSVYLSERGISEKVYLNNEVTLDGDFTEDVWTEEVKTNSINVNANGANVNIMGTLTDDGALFGVTINHTTAPSHSFQNGAWYSYMNVEFRFGVCKSTQFIATCQNHTSLSGMASYCKTVNNGNGYISTFEVFVPFSSMGVTGNVTSLDITCNGWVQTGWCWFFKNDTSWPMTHVLTKTGITTK